MSFTLFGYWPHREGCLPQGIGTQPAYAVFHSPQLKNRSFRNFFFDIVTTHNDHPRYVKHVLGRIYMFFTVFGYWSHKGRGLPRDWYTTCLDGFSHRAAQKSKFSKLTFFHIVIT